MNKKLLAVIFVTAIAGQSAQAFEWKGSLKEVFVNWPKALAPTIWGDTKEKPTVTRYQEVKSDDLRVNNGKVQIKVQNEQDGDQLVLVDNNQGFTWQDAPENLKVSKGKIYDNTKVIVNGDGVNVTTPGKKISKEQRIKAALQKGIGEDSPAKIFNALKHIGWFEKVYFTGSSVAIIATVVAISKKGFDLYQKHAAKKAVVNFDEFDDEDEEEVVDPASKTIEQPKTVEVESAEKEEKTA